MDVFHISPDILIAIERIPAAGELTARQREKHAVGAMLDGLVGSHELTHDSAGKPLLAGWHISISHTVTKQSGYAAVMMSKSREVGVDIEYKSDRVMKIARRFLRDDEHPASVDDHLVYWCAKEAVYKLFSDQDLTYQQMRVNEEMTTVENLKRGGVADIHYVVNDDYVLVYTFCRFKQWVARL